MSGGGAEESSSLQIIYKLFVNKIIAAMKIFAPWDNASRHVITINEFHLTVFLIFKMSDFVKSENISTDSGLR